MNLAANLRPKNFSEFVGQEHLSGDQAILRRIIKAQDDASRVTLTLARGNDYSPFKEENRRMLWRDYAEISGLVEEKRGQTH